MNEHIPSYTFTFLTLAFNFTTFNKSLSRNKSAQKDLYINLYNYVIFNGIQHLVLCSNYFMVFDIMHNAVQLAPDSGAVGFCTFTWLHLHFSLAHSLTPCTLCSNSILKFHLTILVISFS